MIDFHNESGRRWTTAALVGAALLCAAYWTEAALLRFRQALPEAVSRAGTGDPSASASQPLAVVPPADAIAKLLGAPTRLQAAPLGPAERFKVMGVIASASGRGTALIAVDGQPPRPYSVGTELAPGFVLQSVSSQALTLTASPSGAVLATLPLPEPGTASGMANASDAPAAAGSAGAAGATTASGAPPIVSGSRGNPRSETAPPTGPATVPSPGSQGSSPSAAPATPPAAR